MKTLNPNARRDKLVIEQVNDETLIYDVEREQASCLNPTASLVWKYADGSNSVSDIASKMSADLGTGVDDKIVWYALEQLDKKKLMATSVQVPLMYSKLTRRDFLVKAGIVGTAVAIPVVISLVAPTAAMAATCSGGCTGGPPPAQGTCATGCRCSALTGGTCI